MFGILRLVDIGGERMKYEEYNKDDVMGLFGSDLLAYVNYMLSKGYTLAQLNHTKGIRRQTIRDRLKKGGFVFDKTVNRYVSESEIGKIESKTIPLKQTEHIPELSCGGSGENILGEVLDELESLKKRLELIEQREEQRKQEIKSLQGQNTALKVGKLELIAFRSKAKNRNYPLHLEVYGLLDRFHAENPHIKVKDVVNSILYKGLSELYEE